MKAVAVNPGVPIGLGDRVGGGFGRHGLVKDGVEAGVVRDVGQALHDFTTPDLGYWASILEHLDIPRREAILRRQQSSTRGMVLKRDYTTLRRLFDELGNTDDIAFNFQ